MITALYVMCSKNFSGAEIVIERLIANNRDHVRPVVLCPGGAFADRIRSQGIEVVEEPALDSLERGRRRYSRLGLAVRVAAKFTRVTHRVFALIRRERPGLIHANNLAAATYLVPACLIGRALGIRQRWIWSNQDLSYPDGRTSLRLARLCHRVYNRTIAASRAVRGRYEEFGDRIVVVHAGLDPDALTFDPRLRRRMRDAWGLDEGTVAIGIVGTITEGKGHDVLVEVLGRLIGRWPNAILLVVGPDGTDDPTYAPRLRALAERVAPGRVRFTGRLTDMREVYCGLDVVVNATTAAREEPLGTTIYEAMSCERIVVATRTGGSPEIIDHGVNGFLCAPDDANAMAECLGSVLAQLGKLGPMRLAARNKVIRCFSIGRMRTSYNDLLDDLGVSSPKLRASGNRL